MLARLFSPLQGAGGRLGPLAVLLALLAGPAAAQPTAPARVVAPPPESRTLEFIENKGQWDARARYAAQLPGGRLFLEKTGFLYNFVAGLPRHRQGAKAAARGAAAADGPLRAHAVRVLFEGASPAVELRPESPTGGVRNFFRGADPAHWGRRARGFGAVRYAGLWPGIGLRVYENATQQLEYDFELAAGASPAPLRLRYEGARRVQLGPDGRLQVETSAGSFRETVPVAYQLDAAGRRQPVACAYELREQTVRFRLGRYDSSRPLTIDPTVEFSSFTGATADNWGFTATYDPQGNLYSGGICFDVGYPAAPGAYDPQFAGTVDMAFIKYNPSASGPAARVWATYLGGSDAEFPHSLVANERGELVIMGTTSSRDFPTTDQAYSREFNGGLYFEPYGYPPPYAMIRGSDLVVSRLSAQGDSLLASTYLGGAANDGVLDPLSPEPRLVHNYGDYFRGDVLLDPAGNVYLASSTASVNFPTANGRGAPYRGGATDAVVCQLSPDLRTLRWSNLLGGRAADAAYSLQLDKAGQVYVAGGTASTDFPTTAGALQPRAAGDVDAFVARLSPDGRVLQKATFLGTAAYDQAYFLQLDLAGDVYLLGQTRSNLPISPGRYGVANSGQYVQKLAADLSTLRFATVFGAGQGQISLSPTAFLVDQCDRVYISGWGDGVINGSRFGFDNASAAGLPVTANALQKTTDGADFYLAQFSPGMERLEYATYLGNDDPGEGDHVDGGTSRFDPQGIVYQAVCACGQRSSGFPVPPGANTYQAHNGFSNCNNAAFKMRFETFYAATSADSLACVGGPPVRLLGTPSGGIWSGPGVSGSATTGYVFTPSTSLLGTQTLSYAVSGIAVCGGAASLKVRVVAVPPASIAAPSQTAFCPGSAPVTLTGSPSGGTFTGPGIRAGNVFDPQLAGLGTHQLTYTYRNPAAPNLLCPATATLTLRVLPPLVVSADSLACADGPPVRLLGTPAGGVWSGPGVSGSTTAGYIFTPSTSLLGFQTLKYAATNALACGDAATLRLRVVAVPVASIKTPPETTFCTTAAAILLTGSPAGGTFSGPGIRDGNLFDPLLAGAGTHQLTYTYRQPGGANLLCPTTATLRLTVLPPAPVQLPPDTVLCPGSTQAFRLRATPGGGTWTGPGVSGSATAGYVFTPSADLAGQQVALTYTLLTKPCITQATFRISGAAAPLATAFWEPLACPENRVTPLRLRFATASSFDNSTAATVSWDFGDGTPPVTTTTFTSVEHTYAHAGTYQPRATLSYLNGRCQTQAAPPPVTVKDAFYPNIITPNGDQRNATFAPVMPCAMRLRVFSRWGQQVFESPAYANDWAGDGLPAGTYYYLLDGKAGEKIKGWVEIVR